MRLTLSQAARCTLAAAACAAAAGCGSFDSASRGIASAITPYKVEIVQGNVVSKEQVAALRAGMNRAQVREILGTPLVTSLFHADRWEYVFTLKRPGEEIQTRKLTVFFKGDVLERSEGDEMPTETEFVATLGARAGARGKAPVLEATPEQLAKYPVKERPAPAAATTPALPATTSYPPLEAPAR